MLYVWDIVGHHNQLSNLENEIKTGNIAHAYLFSGPVQTGKFRIARKFAAILQCPNNYCGTCPTCIQIQKKVHSDTMVMNDNGESIKIDDIRNLIRKTNLTHQGLQRIIIMENIERMPSEAQNSFLKTLEEPPSKTIFIMTTNQIDEILPTIQSRVRHYHFPTVPYATLKKYLKENFSQSNNLDEILSIAQGRPGLAINMIQDSSELSAQRELYVRIESFLKNNNLANKFVFVEEIAKDPEKIDLFIDACMRYLRKLLFDYMQPEEHSLQTRFSLEKLVNLFEYLEKTRYLLRRNVNKRLLLENLLIQTEV